MDVSVPHGLTRWLALLRYEWRRRTAIAMTSEPLEVTADRIVRAATELATEADAKNDAAQAAKHRATARQLAALAAYERAKSANASRA